MEDFIAVCDHMSDDYVQFRKRFEHDQIEVECSENESVRCSILSEENAERLYEWLGKALGK